MASYRFASRPSEGEAIAFEQNALKVPNHPVIPFIEGDGTGPDIWRASVRVFDAAIEKAYGGERKVAWMKVYAGEKSHAKTGEWLPDETLEACKEFRVSIKGPLTTPVGGGIRSLNVTLRQVLDLYACIRPVRYFEGVGSPMKEPEKLNMVIFRENTEDVYAGIEWKAGSPEANKLHRVHPARSSARTSARTRRIGIKPMSEFGSQAPRRAWPIAVRARERPQVGHARAQGQHHEVHRGRVPRLGLRASRAKEFRRQTVTEADFSKAGGASRADCVVMKDRIADAMFQQLLLRPDEYDVIATPNLNGDYISDAAAAQVGGLGLAPGGNVGDGVAVFEATHGTAPKYANLDKINPGKRHPLGRDDVRVHGLERGRRS